MKIKVDMTVEVNYADIVNYMSDLGCLGEETIQEFVRSWIISGGLGSLDDALCNNGFDHNAVRLVRSNA